MAAKYIAECMSRGSARFEWVAQTAQGRDIPLEVALTRIQWRGRQTIQAFVSDISERKKAEAELHKALAREKELGQLKSNFVSMVSHEFRTPLGVILSSAEILDSYFEQLDPGERREHLKSIQRNTRRMAGLMEEVLVLGMVEAGKMEFKPSPMDLRVFCQRLLEELQTATERKCPVAFEPENVPTKASADERLLRHILSNLIGNAIKYSAAGSPVEFEIRAEGRQAICVVRDRGVGIPPEDQERLFQAFHRGANVRDVPGTGLGLTIVKRCVELHGGTLHLESRPGHGTTVTVSLPLFA
jgi:signal transduction histidine kinase